MPAVTADYDPLTFDEFFADPLKDYPTLADDLKADFVLYKADGTLPRYFGCDVAYTQPFAAFKAQLMHIHLKLPPDRFPDSLPQSDRKCRMSEPHKDAALVYVRGLLEDDKYRILGVLYPEAHAKARVEKIMRYLARRAQEFRDNN